MVSGEMEMKAETETETEEHPGIPYYSTSNFYFIRIIVPILTISFYLLDLFSDLSVAHLHYKNHHHLYFALTLALVVIPTLVISYVSLKWYTREGFEVEPSMCRSALRYICLVLQLSPVLQEMETMEFAWKMRKAQKEGAGEDTVRRYYYLMLQLGKIATTCALLEGFLEDGPQLLLQGYILTANSSSTWEWKFHANYTPYVVSTLQNFKLNPNGTYKEDFKTLGATADDLTSHYSKQLVLFSMLISAIAFSQSISAYQDAMRIAREKPEVSIPGQLMQILWHLFVFMSRAFAIFVPIVRWTEKGRYGQIDLFKLDTLGVLWILSFFSIHWLFTYLWLRKFVVLKTEYLRKPLLAIIYIFTFFNPFYNSRPWIYYVWYLIFLVENCTSIFLIQAFSHGFPSSTKEWELFLRSLTYSNVALVIGIFFSLIYYHCLHPSKKSKFTMFLQLFE